MARDDETNAFELHIEVNRRNLSAIPEKYNINTLRLPSDPSWPKIPLRRLIANTDDIIKPPCVVTLTGTPRKDRNIMRTITRQCPKSRINQQYETCTHILKRLPCFIDPRFKRQISQQKAGKLDESYNAKNNGKQAKPDLDIYILQETKELKDDLQKTNEITNGDTRLYHDVALESVTDEQCNVGSAFSQEQKEEMNRSLLLMVDKRKVHESPINTVNTEAASSSVQARQCYSVQIPVVAYHNVPLQISNVPVQMQKDIKTLYKCQSDSMKREETVGEICTASTLINTRMYTSKESEYKKDLQKSNVENNDDISKNKNISHCDNGQISNWLRDRENVNSSVSLNQDASTEIPFNTNYYENFDRMNDVGYAKNDENSSNIDIEKLETVIEQGHNDSKNNIILHHRSHSTLYNDFAVNLNYPNAGSCITNNGRIVDECIKRKRSSERRIAGSWSHPRTRTRQRLVHSCVKNKPDNMNEFFTNVTTNKILQTNMRGLAFTQARDKKHKRSNEDKTKHEELYSSIKRKMVPINLSRKAKSFFRKKSRLAITNSDCTLILPGPRRNKDKQYENTCGLEINQLSHRRSGINDINSIRMKSSTLKQNRISRSCSLTNLQAENLFEKPSSIPLETQKLLNKSYWEYYRKLRHDKTLARPDVAGKRDKCPDTSQNYLPESQTLQQCSVLSCMINNTIDTAFRNSVAADGRSFSDPTEKIIPNAHENFDEASVLSPMLIKRIKQKKIQAGTQLFWFKNIALFGITIAIIFLPMMYDYFFDEEYDDYENANYIRLTLKYIVSSFEEAFGEIVDILNIAFFTSNKI